MTTPSDERLLKRAATGDEQAFALLYDRYAGRLLSFCRYYLGSRDEAQDAVQQTFMRAHRAIVAGNAPDELRPWLYAVARNRCRSMLAARREREVPVEAIADRAALDGLADEVQRREDLRSLVHDLDGLPEAQRSALVLFELGDLSQRDVGDVLGVPESKVKALVHQARTHLIAERAARERSCDDVRAELGVARGAALRRGPLRRHVRSCPACRAWQADLGRQRVALAAVLPVALLGSREAALTALGVGTAGAGAAVAGAGAGAAGAGFAGMGAATKVLAAVAALGVGAAGTEVAVKSARDPNPAQSAPRHARPSVQRPPAKAGVEPATVVPAALTTPAIAQAKLSAGHRRQKARIAARKEAKRRLKALHLEAVKARKLERDAVKALKHAKSPKPAKRARRAPRAEGRAKQASKVPKAVPKSHKKTTPPPPAVAKVIPPPAAAAQPNGKAKGYDRHRVG